MRGVFALKGTRVSAIKKTFTYGRHLVTLETGEIARQAGGAVIVNMDDTVVLVTVVGQEEAKPGQDFFPLTVDYQEKTYAAGRIPGGFFKREGRPSEKETLISRLIDRPIRPLFPEGFLNEVQVDRHGDVARTPKSIADIPAMIGASAALTLSGMPFNGPIGAARVGYHRRRVRAQPDQHRAASSRELDLVVAGTETAVLMVESEARSCPKTSCSARVVFGHDADAGRDQRDQRTGRRSRQAGVGLAAARRRRAAMVERLKALAEDDLQQAYNDQAEAGAHGRRRRDAQQGRRRTDRRRQATPTHDAASRSTTCSADSKPSIVRSQILAGEPRIDGRDTRTVRPITIRTGVLPRTHGSALFTRGETQALVVTTLGTGRDAQIIDALEGEYKDRFMLHYNFPPFSTGETGRVGSPKRREIGHGRLAKRALIAVLPSKDDFPLHRCAWSPRSPSPTARSSMASVCGGCLSLMDAGVPMKAPVAGIAMGLIKEGNRFAVLTDILGDEDHLGDMDFKVAGTDEGVTALQMDIKIEGITKEIMQVALDAGQGRPPAHPRQDEARRCPTPRAELSAVRAAHHHDQDQPGEDPRRHRQGRRRDPRADRGDRQPRSTSRTTAPSRSPRASMRSRRTGARSASRRSPPKSKSARSTKARSPSCWTSARSSTCCPARTACCTSPRSPTSASRSVTDYLKEGQIVRSRCSRPTRRAASSCR